MKVKETSPEFIIPEHAHSIKTYFELLGGDKEEFPSDTIRRVLDFSSELANKRMYDRFTTFDSTTDEMIIGNHLRVFSFCEHHLLPFFGEATIAYLPEKKILGLSKFQRLIDKCAATPTLQERLTQEVKLRLIDLLNPRGVAIQIKAIHTCVLARGPLSSNAEFTTTALYGRFKESADTRNEFIQSISNNSRVRM